MNRFDRITGILLQLQARRVVRGQALAERFGVSLRTIYRDLRTLEAAGVPLYGEAGVGFSLAEGYRLPPVMFTRDEAVALLTGEKLAARLTDEQTATHSREALDKLRAVLRRPDRDYLDALAPRLEVRRLRTQPATPAADSGTHQRLLAATMSRRVVRLCYRAGLAEASTARDVEPIGCYLQQQWHLVAYCRLRQDFRDFRFDRIEHLEVRDETFPERPETLNSYWSAQAVRRQQLAVARVRFQPEAVRSIQDTKHQYGWVQEEVGPDGTVEMSFLPGSLRYLAAWLLPQAGSFRVVTPPELQQQLRELAQAAHACFGDAG
ncbi:YafY family transcriptional regulator [Hymenobacter tibetensis]|uniref:YafY family transcriptional regulator n=1 Tax=Hymenobacter tibetensis TaxID=497967 RepID=A0ABY4CT74_9BACT|nr:YafY family protein [Hymenobacter tibetensis]UOG73321.1 YafY family transcriptional regulator [Hymenobacter tibetensis]